MKFIFRISLSGRNVSECGLFAPFSRNGRAGEIPAPDHKKLFSLYHPRSAPMGAFCDVRNMSRRRMIIQTIKQEHQMEFTARRLMRGCMALAGAAALMAGAAINAHAQFQGIYGGGRADAAEGGIIQSGDEFVAVGYSDSYGNDRDVYVVKTDKCGNIVWARTIDFGGEDVGRKI
ncbi:MAG: hypothetical protein ABI876_10225, partial [Bacteroidota bacterium]